MTEFRKQLRQLLSDESYRTLASLEPDFDLFEALGVTYRELSHSALLAYLLDPNKPHGLGTRILQKFLDRLIQSPPSPNDGQELVSLEKEIGLRFTDVVVYREKFNIDVVVELRESKFVVAIENKLWAGEQDDQVKGYQDTINRYYPEWGSIMVFLTPYGHESTTSAAAHNVPCVSMRWSDISSILESVEVVSNDAVRFFLQQTRWHIQEDIVGEVEKKRLVRELFGNPEHVQIISLIDKYRPQLVDCGELLSKNLPPLIKSLFKCETVDEGRYPSQRGLPKEFQFSFKPEVGAAVSGSLVLVVYHYPDWARDPGVLLTTWSAALAENRPWYESLATMHPNLFDPSLPRYSYWSDYYRVLKETDYEGFGIPIPTHTFDEVFVNEVVAKSRHMLEPLADSILGPGIHGGQS